MKAQHEVVIVGGGPTGLMLAAELRLWNIDVVVVERDAAASPVVRSLGLHARSIEILDQRGLLDAFLAYGQRYPLRNSFAGIDRPAPDDLDTAHPYLLGIPQPTTDRLLEEHARTSGAHVRRGSRVVAVRHEVGGAEATVVLDHGEELSAAFVVGCDGGRSTVRRETGIAFVGEGASTTWLLAEVELRADAAEAMAVSAEVRKTDLAFGIGPVGEGIFRIAVREASPTTDREVTIDAVRERLRAVAGTDLGAHSPRWLSRFGDATRVAEHYRAGRVLLAGDAAHVHAPLGGQGLNLGIQDAVNLGFKLAWTLRGRAPADLLDTYGSERRPVAEQVLRNTRAQSELLQATPGPVAARGLLAELAEIDEVNRRLIEMVTGIGVRYEMGSPSTSEEKTAEAMVGRRLRDISVSGGRLYEVMQDGRGALLDSSGALDADGHADRVNRREAAAPDIGAAAVLLRPDGHIVWAGDDRRGLDAALARWFGVPGSV